MSRMTSKKKTFLLIQWGVVGIVVALIAGFGVASSVGNWQLRNLLARWTVLSLQAAFILALCFAVLAWKDIHQSLAGVSRRAWAGLAILLALGLVLVAFVAPRTNRIYFDEQLAYDHGYWIGNRFSDLHNIIWMLGGDRNAVNNIGDQRSVYRALAEGVADGINGSVGYDGHADYSTI